MQNLDVELRGTRGGGGGGDAVTSERRCETLLRIF